MAERVRNLGLIIHATKKAASSELKSPDAYKQYLQEISQTPIRRLNPSYSDLRQELLGQIPKQLLTRSELLTLPWAEDHGQIDTPARPYSAFVAFLDDQKHPAREFFPPDLARNFLGEVVKKSESQSSPITIPEQFAIALDMTGSNPVAAAVLAHASFRSVARNADTVADDGWLRFSAGEMARVARATADFENASQRDPLGDTYHFWSQFSSQMIFSLIEGHRVQTRIYKELFKHGPWLHKTVRSEILGKKMDNFHEEANRLGWALGTEMGKFLDNQQRLEQPLRRSRGKVVS